MIDRLIIASDETNTYEFTFKINTQLFNKEAERRKEFLNNRGFRI
jgi:hypothetical protein